MSFPICPFLFAIFICAINFFSFGQPLDVVLSHETSKIEFFNDKSQKIYDMTHTKGIWGLSNGAVVKYRVVNPLNQKQYTFSVTSANRNHRHEIRFTHQEAERHFWTVNGDVKNSKYSEYFLEIENENGVKYAECKIRGCRQSYAPNHGKWYPLSIMNNHLLSKHGIQVDRSRKDKPNYNGKFREFFEEIRNTNTDEWSLKCKLQSCGKIIGLRANGDAETKNLERHVKTHPEFKNRYDQLKRGGNVDGASSSKPSKKSRIF